MRAWKKFLKNRSDKNREAYRDAKKESRIKVDEAKRKSWKEFGTFMEEIKNKEEQLLTESKNVMIKEYFRDFLEEQDTDGDGGDAEAYSAVDAVSASRENHQRVTLEKFFETLERVKLGKSPGHDRMPSIGSLKGSEDETGMTTAHKPLEIIGAKGQKQISKVTSTKRGILVTLCCAINALSNSVPPFFILSRVRQQEYMTQDAPPGFCCGDT
ncbi:hypothetical protein ILUMI_27118 [Ignelater luminosus]|uniref:Uncharacterized protein n=1 Tax=Ignelater luminosus TaxID=2038154 RepID=A0A8K0C3S1_IGNLU|nr:hypothetical protein ILUMI_27118 [Ignelater luminosus]